MKKFTIYKFTVVGFVLAVLLTALAIGDAIATAQTSTDGQFPKTVDVEGEHVVIPHKPMRIAAGSGDVADIMLEFVDPDRLVVVPVYMDNPAIYRNYAKAETIKNRVASSVDLDPEAVLAHDPDLVILTVRQTAERDALELIKASGIPVVGIHEWDGFDELITNIELIGEVVGEEQAARAVAEDMRRRLADIETRLQGVEPKRVLPLSVFSPGGTTPFFIGPTSFKYDVLRRAGAQSDGDRLGITSLVRADIEQVVQLNPKYMLLTDWAGTGAAAYRDFLEHPTMQLVDAVADDNVLVLPYRELWISLDAVDGVEKVARWLYPERFE